MNRKAEVNMPQEASVGLIILLAVLVLVMVVTVALGNASLQRQSSLECEISRFFNEVGDEVTNGLFNPFEVHCPRQLITMKEGVITAQHYDLVSPIAEQVTYQPIWSEQNVDGDWQIRTAREESVEDPVLLLNRVLALESMRCWQKFGEGQNDVLGSDSIFAKQNSCLICTEIITTQDLPDAPLNYYPAHVEKEGAVGISSENMGMLRMSIKEYLYNNNAPSFPARCAEGIDANLLMEDLQSGTGESYSIVFVRRGRGLSDIVNWARNFFGRDTSVTHCQFTATVKTKDVVKLCDSVVN